MRIQHLPHTPVHRLAALLSIAVLLAGMLPLGAMAAWGSGVSTGDTCCPAGGELQFVSPSGDQTEDCCDAHCRGCFLKCCNGIRSLSPDTVAMDPVTHSEYLHAGSTQSGAPSHLHAIEHPPRG